MSIEQRVFIGVVVPFLCWICFMWGQSRVQCPEGINEMPAAKYKEAQERAFHTKRSEAWFL